MAHSTLGRGSHTCNKTNNGFLFSVILLEPLCCQLLVFTSNFSDNNDTLSLRINNESLEDVDEVSTVKRISSDSYNCALS